MAEHELQEQSRESVLAWASRQSWACESRALTGMVTELREGRGPLQAAAGRRRAAVSRSSGRVGVLQVMGPVEFRPMLFSAVFGGVSVLQLQQELAELVRDDDIDSIILDVDSPGGAADGIMELAEQLRRARLRKPVVAVVHPFAASAAYWLASSASEIVMLGSGQAGSIGVYSLHVDRSGALAQRGVKPTFIVSKGSPKKTDASPFAPLSREARADVQRSVDRVYEQFVSSVAAGRNQPIQQVRAYATGALFDADEAEDRGLVDTIGAMNVGIGRALFLGKCMRVRRSHTRLAVDRAKHPHVAS